MKYTECGFLNRQCLGVADPYKYKVRERILQHILDNQNPNSVRFFGFPGPNWHFERMLESAIGEDHLSLIGVERDYNIFELARGHIPGQLPIDSAVGDIEVVYTNHTILLHTSLYNFISKPISASLRKWTAFWLDYSAVVETICRDLPLIPKLCDDLTVPFAITFVKGHDRKYASPMARVDEMHKALLLGGRRCSMPVVLEYPSASNCPMVVVLGFLYC